MANIIISTGDQLHCTKPELALELVELRSCVQEKTFAQTDFSLKLTKELLCGKYNFKAGIHLRVTVQLFH